MDKMKIIVVEDNPVYNTFVCKLLANNGFKTEQIYHLSSARKALIKADNDDIVLADLRLPDGESIELLKWMRVNDKRQGVHYHDRLRRSAYRSGEHETRFAGLYPQTIGGGQTHFASPFHYQGT